MTEMGAIGISERCDLAPFDLGPGEPLQSLPTRFNPKAA
jgi:hypothetical protein